jgi:threonine dehydratase
MQPHAQPSTAPPGPERMIGAVQIEQAARTLREVAVTTPVLPCQAPDWAKGLGPVLLKCENLQRTGSFKVRGAYLRVAALTAAARARGVATASAGNHGQGVALAASRFATSATVWMPAGAPRTKVAATRALGARVELVDAEVTSVLDQARAVATERGLTWVHPFDDPYVIAGQATVGLELVRQLPHLGTVVVPVGGGGLLAGVASAVKAHRPAARVVGVQAAGAAAFAASLAAGAPVGLERVDTIADGIAVARPGALPVAIAAGLVDELVTVTDEQLWEAMHHCWRELRLVAEPAGAAALAGLAHLTGGDHGSIGHGPVVAVVSGGNIDHRLGARLMAAA